MDPQDLVARLTDWAEPQPWIEWLELAGSLGRGAGDPYSDVDAGIGVSGSASDRVDTVLDALATFGEVAGSSVERWDEGAHLSVFYATGTELSLVVVEASFRTGLPPEARALIDRAGRLATPLPPDRWQPDEATMHDWTYKAWTTLADAARHAHRDRPWRALHSLTESRDLVWQLWAASLGLTYPQFGAVTVENAGAAVPEGIGATHPVSLDRAALNEAVDALATVIRRLEADPESPMAAAVAGRLEQLRGS